MTTNSLSQKVSELSQRLEELQAKYKSNPADAAEILSDALESLHSNLEGLLDAEKMLKLNNEESIKSAKERTDSQALAHQLQVQKIELEMQNEELKRAKLEAESMLAKYSDIYDFSPIGLFTLDVQGRILEANLAGATFLGMARGSLMNNSFRQFVAPKDRRSFDDFCKSAFGTSTRQLCELRLIRNDGSTIYVRIDGTATEDRLLDRKQLRIDVIDITERKQAKEALLVSEEQFRRAVEDAPIPMIMHAEDGQVLQISRTWTELTGYTSADMSTFDAWLNRAYGEGADSVRDYIQKLFEGNQRMINIEFPVRTTDGQIRHWSFSASSPGRLLDGRRFIVGMAVDITESKQAKEALQKANDELEQRVQERTAELQQTSNKLEVINAKLVDEIKCHAKDEAELQIAKEE